MGLRQNKTLFADQDEEPSPIIDASTVPKPVRKAAGARKTISDLYLSDAVVGVKESINCGSLAELRTRLVEVLGK